MVEINEVYEELDFLEQGQIILINPGNKLEKPCFFIKESEYIISKLINKREVEFEVRIFTVGNVIAQLLTFKFDKSYYDYMYGQWINIYSKVDKKTFTEVSFDEFINIIFINKSNKVKYVDSFRNMFRGNIGKLFKIDKGMVKWSQNEFNSAVTLLTEGETKKSFYEKILN